MSASYDEFPHLRFDRPADGVLRITLDAPGLNAVGPDVHRELADVWLVVDRDSETNVALAGRVLVTLMPLAAEGPRLVTSRE